MKIENNIHEENREAEEKIWRSHTRYNGYEYSVSLSRLEEVEELCAVVSADEVLELWHLFRMPVEDALRKSIEYSGQSPVYSIYRENEYEKQIIGMGGLNPLIGGRGTVGELWFMGADMDEHARFLIRHTKEILRMFFEKCPVLINVIGVWNKRGIRWLHYLGFCVEKKSEYMGLNQALFHRFYMTKEAFYTRHPSLLESC